MGLGLSATDRAGKSERTEMWTYTLFILVISWDLLTIKNVEKHQPLKGRFSDPNYK